MRVKAKTVRNPFIINTLKGFGLRPPGQAFPKAAKNTPAAVPTEIDVSPQEAENFGLFIDELCHLADHNLNQAVVEELLDIERHHPVWAFDALLQFRKAFPSEPSYHKAYGDLNDKLGIYDEAVEGYATALRLTPKNERSKLMQTRQKRGRVKRKRKGQEKKGVAVDLENARKKFDKSNQEQKAVFIKILKPLWDRVKVGDRKNAVELIGELFPLGDAAFVPLRLDSFESVTESSGGTPKERLEKLDHLRDFCHDELGLEKAAEYFHYLGDLLLSNIFKKIAAGHSFEREEHRIAFFRDADDPEVMHTVGQAVSFQLLEEVLENNLIEEADNGLMQRMLNAASNERHRHHNLAKIIIARLIGKRVYEATALFLEAVNQREAEGYPDASLLEKAADKLREALKFIKQEGLLIQLAIITAMQGRHLADLGKPEEARAKFQESLGIDKNSILALESLAMLSIADQNYEAVIDFCLRLINAHGSKKKKDTEPLPISIKEESIAEFVHKAYQYLGYASIEFCRYASHPETTDYVVENLELAVQKEDAPDILKFCLIDVYFLTKKYQKGFDLLNIYLEGKDKREYLRQIITFSSDLWFNIGLEDIIPQEVYRFFVDYFMDIVRDGVNEGSKIRFITYGIYLAEYGAAMGDTDALVQAQSIFDYIIKEQEPGTDAYYYTFYAMAQKACDIGDLKTARNYLVPLIDAGDVTFEIYSEALGDYCPVRAGAYDLLVQIYLAIAANVNGNKGKDRAKARRYMRLAREVLLRAQEEFPESPIIARTKESYNKRRNGKASQDTAN